MEAILDNIFNKVKIRKITSLVKDIKKRPNLRNDKTITSIAYLAYWLYIIDENDLAMEIASLIDKIPFEGDFVIWERVRDAFILESFIYKEKGDIEKSKESLQKITMVGKVGDESTLQKHQRILDRVLNGALLYDKFIIEDQQENDIQAEITHRFLQFKTLCYMKGMGGSEKYPIEYLVNEMQKEKLFLKEKATIAK
jgi:hypothetical protein